MNTLSENTELKNNKDLQSFFEYHEELCNKLFDASKVAFGKAMQKEIFSKNSNISTSKVMLEELYLEFKLEKNTIAMQELIKISFLIHKELSKILSEGKISKDTECSIKSYMECDALIQKLRKLRIEILLRDDNEQENKEVFIRFEELKRSIPVDDFPDSYEKILDIINEDKKDSNSKHLTLT